MLKVVIRLLAFVWMTILASQALSQVSNAEAQPDFLSLDQAIQIGLENNFDVKIAANNYEVADNNLSRGNAGFLPQVNLTGGRSYTNQNVRQEFISGQMNERDGAKSNAWNSNVGLTWTVFDGLRMFKTYSRLQEQVQIASLDEQIEVEAKVKEIVIGYNQIVLEKNRLSAFDSSLRLSKTRMDLAKSRFDLGKASKIDYLSAQVDYNNDSSLLIKQTEAVTKAKYNLNNLLGVDIREDFNVPLTIPVDSSLVLSELRDLAEERNRELQRSRRNLSVAELEMREIRGEKMPQLGVNVSYGYNKSSSEAGFLLSNQTDGLNYGLSASWLLFNGNNINRRYQNAMIERESDLQRLNKAELELERDLESIYLEYKNNLLLVRLEQLNLEVALENTQIALDRYSIGNSSFVELREAQVNSVRAYISLIDSIFSAKIGELDLLDLSGQLSSLTAR